MYVCVCMYVCMYVYVCVCKVENVSEHLDPSYAALPAAMYRDLGVYV